MMRPGKLPNHRFMAQVEAARRSVPGGRFTGADRHGLLRRAETLGLSIGTAGTIIDMTRPRQITKAQRAEGRAQFDRCPNA